MERGLRGSHDEAVKWSILEAESEREPGTGSS